jgi:uncharacterized membrane protein
MGTKGEHEDTDRSANRVSGPSMRAAAHMNRNVETIAILHARAEETVGHHQRFIERLTTVVGRPSSFYSIAITAASWIAFNLVAPRFGVARPPDPPPFVWLQGIVAFAALLMTTMVLTTQNRQAKQAERRAELDLQVNLLSEQKITKVIALFEELRRDMPAVRNREDPVANAMAHAVDPHDVISALESTFEPGESTPPAPSQNPSRSVDDQARRRSTF